ncbi:MAG: hypothetical protein J5717_08225 [Lachnospiraceae bacterium]|nr:hypothetical protein [Lachnospiraceae bacterium]
MFDLKDLVWSDVELDSDKASLGGDTYETMDNGLPGPRIPVVLPGCFSGGGGGGVVQRIGCIDVSIN